MEISQTGQLDRWITTATANNAGGALYVLTITRYGFEIAFWGLILDLFHDGIEVSIPKQTIKLSLNKSHPLKSCDNQR